MKSFSATAIVCLFMQPIWGQVSMQDVLSFPLTDDEMGVVLARENYLATHKFNSPWLRELDFRIRPNNEETSISDYRLRFGILNPREIKANRDYYKVLIHQQAFERKKSINSVLQRRYQLIIEGHYLLRAVEINEENLAQLLNVRTLLLNESPEGLRELLATEEEITKQELTINNLRRKMTELLPAYQLLGMEDLSTFSAETWLTKEQAEEVISRKAGGETLTLLSDQQELEREASLLEINKAEAFSNLGFIQTEYDGERGDTRDEHIRFQVGIQIPIFNTDRPDNQRRELELIEEQAEYASAARDEHQLRQTQAQTLVDFLKDWALLHEKTAQLETYRKVLDETGGNLKQLDQLREYTYFLEMKTLTTRMDIYLRYIDFLAESGTLAEQPYLNYLTETLTSFELRALD